MPCSSTAVDLAADSTFDGLLVFGVTPKETTRVSIDLTAETPSLRARVESGAAQKLILTRD